jgi:hypothetical protein
MRTGTYLPVPSTSRDRDTADRNRNQAPTPAPFPPAITTSNSDHHVPARASILTRRRPPKKAPGARATSDYPITISTWTGRAGIIELQRQRAILGWATKPRLRSVTSEDQQLKLCSLISYINASSIHNAENKVTNRWRDLTDPEKDTVLDFSSTSYIALLRINLGHGERVRKSNKNSRSCLRTRCYQRRDDVEGAAIAPIQLPT